MLKCCLALLASAAAAMAAVEYNPVEYRAPARGFRSMEFSSNSAWPVVTFRASPDSMIEVLGVSSSSVEPVKGDRAGHIVLSALNEDWEDTVLVDIAPTCPDREVFPTCTLEVYVPDGIDLRAGADNGHLVFDGLKTALFVRCVGTVSLLNHGASAAVTGGKIVCSIRDPGPADTVTLRSSGYITGVELYYPDNLPAHVRALANNSSVYVDGISAQRAQGGWGGPEKFPLNHAAGTCARFLDLQCNGDIFIRPLSALGKTEE
jgi:hypothetical protein